MLGLAQPAFAQAPGQLEPVSAAFLERRVPDELANEGVVLSRRSLGLKVEPLADKWLVSLVDLTTERVVASTRLDALPADREAAVASMTHVVADLAAQVVGREPYGQPVPAAVGLNDPNSAAEQKYRREALRFGQTLYIEGQSPSVTAYAPVHGWRGLHMYRGDLDVEVEPADFYHLINRPDLLARYNTRRQVAVGTAVLGAAGLIAGTIVAVSAFSDSCTPPSLTLGPPISGDPFAGYNACEMQHQSDLTHDMIVSVSLTVASLGVFLVSAYYYTHPHPISDGEVASLADQYNQQLRLRLGLPTVSEQRAPLLQDVKLAPYAAGRDAGLAISGRF